MSKAIPQLLDDAEVNGVRLGQVKFFTVDRFVHVIDE